MINKKNILFINHKQKQCGVYQYGRRVAEILGRSIQYNFIYCEVDSVSEFSTLVGNHLPHGIIYNYHPSTMAWINSGLLKLLYNTFHYGIHHEGHQTMSVGFDHILITDPSSSDTEAQFSVPRPLFENLSLNITKPSIPTIGSFGFGFHNKGFERLVKMVNNEFEEAIIRLHIPFAHYGDMDGGQAMAISNLCQSHITKEKIKLFVTHDFMSDESLLQFLASNTLNAFLYDEMLGRGVSSVIDYALSVNTPIAITDTFMFRHIPEPKIRIENHTFKKIIEYGSSVIQPFRDKWSNSNLINKYENLILKTIKI